MSSTAAVCSSRQRITRSQRRYDSCTPWPSSSCTSCGHWRQAASIRSSSRWQAGDCRREMLSESASTRRDFEVRLDRGLAQPLAGLGRDVGGDERMAVAVATHPRAEAEHRRNLDAAVRDNSSPPPRAARRAPSAPSPTAPAGTRARDGLRASTVGAAGTDEIGLPELDQLAAQLRMQPLGFAGQQLLGIQFVHHAANRPHLRAQRLAAWPRSDGP